MSEENKDSTIGNGDDYEVPMETGGSAEAARGDDDNRKLFVGGLSWETSDKDLREHFHSYGEIENINLKSDPNTGRTRGFAFILFSSADAIDKVLASGNHVINNRKVDAKRAKARNGKVFVGGLSPGLSKEDVKEFFGQYGAIVEVEMPFDKTKNQGKGYCFITFESLQVANQLLKSPKQLVHGKEVDIKKVTPKPDGMGAAQGRGGRGRGREATRGSRAGYGGYDGYGMYNNYYDSYGSPGYGAYEYSLYSGLVNYGGGSRGGKQRGGSSQVQRRQPY